MDNKIREITLVTYFPTHIGGLYSHMISLNDALLQRGYKVNLVFNEQNSYLIKIVKAILLIKNKLNIPKAKIDLTKYKLKKLEQRLEIYKETTDIFHFHDILSASLLQNFDNKVLTVHGPLSKEAKMLNQNSKKYIDFLKNHEIINYKKIKNIIAVDSGQKEILVNEYNIDNSNITVMFNSVNTDIFRPLETDFDSNYIIVPRRFVKKNGVEIAVKAMKFLKDLDIKMYLIGEGPEKENIEKIISKLSLSEKVKNLGPKNHTELIPLIQKCKFLLVPSIPDNGVVEATSISALEGMACGKVVIGSNIGGIAEIIEDEYNGFLFEQGDSKALAEKIIHALNIKDIKTIETNARKDVLNHYSHNKTINSILEIYTKSTNIND